MAHVIITPQRMERLAADLRAALKEPPTGSGQGVYYDIQLERPTADSSAVAESPSPEIQA